MWWRLFILITFSPYSVFSLSLKYVTCVCVCVCALSSVEARGWCLLPFLDGSLPSSSRWASSEAEALPDLLAELQGSASVCSWLQCWGYRPVTLSWEPELRFTNQAISLDLYHYFKVIFLLKDLHLSFLTVRITAPPHTHFIGNVPRILWGRWLESSGLTFNSCRESHSRINTCHCQSLILSKLRVWKF